MAQYCTIVRKNATKGLSLSEIEFVIKQLNTKSLEKLSGDNIDNLALDLCDSMLDYLRSKGVAVLKEESNDLINYAASVENLIEDTRSKLKIKIKLAEGEDESLKTNLLTKALDKLKNKLTNEDIDREIFYIKENVTNPDKETPELKHERKLRDFTRYYYGSNTGKFFGRLTTKFANSIFNTSIISINSDINKCKIITSNEDLNNSIEILLNTFYDKVFKYCREQGLIDDLLENKILGTYIRNHSILENVQTVLDRFETHLNKLRKDNLLENRLRVDYLNYLKNDIKKGELVLLDVLDSFISIKYFDDLIIQTTGKYLYISKTAKANNKVYDLNKPVTIINTENSNKTFYKYRLNTQTNVSKGWTEGDSFKDGLTQLGNFSTFLIQLIPNIGKNGVNLTKAEFIIVFNKLREAIMNYVGSYSTLNDLKKVLIGVKDPVQKWRTILSIMNDIKIDKLVVQKESEEKGEYLTTREGASIWNALKASSELNDPDLYIIKSVYDYIFSKKAGKHGIYEIETKEHLFYNNKNSFGLTYTLFGTLEATCDRKYYEITTDFITGEPVYKLKSRYNTDQRVHQYLVSINTKANLQPYTLTLSEIQTVVNLRKSDYLLPDKSIRFKIGNLEYGIDSADPSKRTFSGLFTRSRQNTEDCIAGIYLPNKGITSIDEYFKLEIRNLNNESFKLELLDPNVNGNPKIEDFKNLLRFLKDLYNIPFLSRDGLDSLYILFAENKNNFKNLFFVATQIAVANSLNTKFKQLVLNDSTYRGNLEKFIAEQGFDPKNFIIKNDINGNFILVLSSTNGLLNNVLNRLNTAISIINGQTIKSVIKNKNRENIPNTSIYFTLVKEELARLDDLDSAAGQLLFAGVQSEFITNVGIDNDGDINKVKEVKNYSHGELTYHLFVDKFALNLDSNKIIVLPTVYSDKVSLLNVEIDLGILEEDMSENNLIKKSFNTLGNYYNQVKTLILNDYKLIGHKFGAEIQDFGDINSFLKGKTVDEILDVVDELNREGNNIRFYLDLHYIKLNGLLTINTALLYYTDEVFNSLEKYRNILEQSLFEYLKDWVDNNVIVSIGRPTSGDISKYTKLQKALLRFLPKGEKIRTWIAEDGNMIIAKKKSYDENNKEIIEDIVLDLLTLNKGEELIVNPLIREFFFMHNLFANNLKLALNGNELFHPYKAFNREANNAIAKVVSMIKSDPQIRAVASDTTGYPEEELVSNGEKLLTMFDLHKLKQTLQARKHSPELINKLTDILDPFHNKMLSVIQGVLFKRTIALPATMRLFTHGKWDGIPDNYNIVIGENIMADVWDYEGKYGYGEESKIEAHDGGTFVVPWISTLENNSLDDQPVGEVKKPLWEIDDPYSGTKILIKNAVTSLTNANMRNQVESDLSQFVLFKKMTDSFKWNESNLWRDNEIGEDINIFDYYQKDWDDEAESYYTAVDDNEHRLIDFTEDIMKGKSLYKKRGPRDYRVIDVNAIRIGKRVLYYTVELNVSENSEEGNIYMFHFFDDNSNLISAKYNKHTKQLEFLDPNIPSPNFTLELNETSRLFTFTGNENEVNDFLNNNNISSVNSLYQFHSILGGIHSMSEGEHGLIESEASNDAVVAFMNDICYKKESSYDNLNLRSDGKVLRILKQESLTQDLFVQPLKHLLNHYYIPIKSSKSASPNVNTIESLTDPNKKLHHVRVSNSKYGILLDADHDVDESDVSEPTQIISALASTGLYLQEVTEIYKALGEQTLNALNLELEALALGNDALYDIIGKTIINNISGDERALVQSIIQVIKDNFGLSTNHKLDDFKISFSCDSLYKKLLQIVGSVINKKAIKRKYPGSAQVLIPSYGMFQTYKIGKEVLQYLDLVSRALKKLRHSAFKNIRFTGDQIQYEKDLVKAYLNEYLPSEGIKTKKEIDLTQPVDLWGDSLEPEDVLDITIKNKNGEVLTKPKVRLNSLVKYYGFVLDPKKFIKELFNIDDDNFEIISILNNFTYSRDLSPSYIRFDYNGRRINIFNTWIYRALFKLGLIASNKSLNSEIVNEAKKELERIRGLLPKFYELLEKGIYISNLPENALSANLTGNRESDEIIKSKLINHLDEPVIVKLPNGEEIETYPKSPKISNLEISAAETILSYPYTSRMGINQNDSLPSVLQKDLKSGGVRELSGRDLQFDFQLTGIFNEQDSLISISEEQPSTNYRYSWVDYIDRERSKLHSEKYNDSMNRIYVIDRNNNKLFEIGREVLEKDITYDQVNKVFRNKDGKIIHNIHLRAEFDGEHYKVYNFKLFVLKGIVTSGKGIKYTKYNIDPKYIKQVLLEGETINSLTADLIKLILISVGAGLIQLSNQLLIKENGKPDRYHRIRNVVELLADRYSGTDLGDYFILIKDNILRSTLPSFIEKIFLGKDSNPDALFWYNPNELNKEDRTLLLSNIEQVLKACKSDNIIKSRFAKIGFEVDNKGEVTGDKHKNISLDNLNSISMILYNKLISILKKDPNLGYIPDIIKFLDFYWGSKLFESKLEEAKAFSENNKIIDKIDSIIDNLEGKDSFKDIMENSILHNANLRFFDKLVKKKNTSFRSSLEFIASRIPAQGLQSFMKMRAVGFLNTSSSLAAVSHFQLFLQGSDYDIDKAYMMGKSFDEFGIFVGWSDLFDYSSVEALTLSEKLPLPRQRGFKKSDKGIDLSYYNNIIENEFASELEKLEAVVNALLEIEKRAGNQNEVELVGVDDQLLELLNKHENTSLNSDRKEDALKNYIVVNIGRLIEHVLNVTTSYRPVVLDNIQKAASKSPKQLKVTNMTLFNPAYIVNLLIQNMSGKKTVGIAANGQKALYISKYVTLEVILNKGEEEHKYVTFRKIFKRVKDNKPVGVQIIPNIKGHNYVLLFPTVAPDDIGSQYITAATDNAKELVLYIINSGTKMAKYHLYLLSLGFDVEEIIKFMTRPIVNLIDNISDENIFENNVGVNIKGIITGIKKYLDNINSEGGILSIKGLDSIICNKVKHQIDELIREGNTAEDLLLDLEELEMIGEGADEYTTLSRLLSINQGVPQTKEDLIKFKDLITTALINAERRKGFRGVTGKFSLENVSEELVNEYSDVMGDNFDVDKWISDDEYKKKVIDYYNEIKDTYNVFYIIDNAPHYKAMYEALKVLNAVDSKLSLKSKIVNNLFTRLKRFDPYASLDYLAKLLLVADIVLVKSFIMDNLSDMKLELPKGETILDVNYKVRTILERETLLFNSDLDISNYKYFVEQYLIPNLKTGLVKVLNKRGDSIDIKDNIVISDLLMDIDQNIPILRLPIDMIEKDRDLVLLDKFLDYVNGVRQLSKVTYQGYKVSDLLMLYNLIVNKDSYGSSKLTELFETFISNYNKYNDMEDSIIIKYYKYMGQSDKDSELNVLMTEEFLLEISLKDALLLVCPTVKSTKYTREPFVKMFDDLGNIVYYEKFYSQEHRQIEYKQINFVEEDKTETPEERLERVRNLFRYGFGLPYSNYVNKVVSILSSDNKDKKIAILKDLLYRRLLGYKIIC